MSRSLVSYVYDLSFCPCPYDAGIMFAAPSPSPTWPLKAHSIRRQAASSAAATSRVPLAAQISQHTQNERLK